MAPYLSPCGEKPLNLLNGIYPTFHTRAYTF